MSLTKMKMYNLIQKDGNIHSVIAKGNFQQIEFLLYSTLDQQNIECINNHIGLHECKYHDASGVAFDYEMVETEAKFKLLEDRGSRVKYVIAIGPLEHCKSVLEDIKDNIYLSDLAGQENPYEEDGTPFTWSIKSF